jgi:hypothetical protein
LFEKSPTVVLISRIRTFPVAISNLSVGEVAPMPTCPDEVTAKSLACCAAEGVPVFGLSFAPSI